MTEERPSGKHAKPDLAKWGGHVEALAEAWMEIQFAAERSVTALDGFIAGWQAAEQNLRGNSADTAH